MQELTAAQAFIKRFRAYRMAEKPAIIAGVCDSTLLFEALFRGFLPIAMTMLYVFGAIVFKSVTRSEYENELASLRLSSRKLVFFLLEQSSLISFWMMAIVADITIKDQLFHNHTEHRQLEGNSKLNCTYFYLLNIYLSVRNLLI